jgi:hypothetical protein
VRAAHDAPLAAGLALERRLALAIGENGGRLR